MALVRVYVLISSRFQMQKSGYCITIHLARFLHPQILATRIVILIVKRRITIQYDLPNPVSLENREN
jgi:hypothetical protein